MLKCLHACVNVMRVDAFLPQSFAYVHVYRRIRRASKQNYVCVCVPACMYTINSTFCCFPQFTFISSSPTSFVCSWRFTVCWRTCTCVNAWNIFLYAAHKTLAHHIQNKKTYKLIAENISLSLYSYLRILVSKHFSFLGSALHLNREQTNKKITTLA